MRLTYSLGKGEGSHSIISDTGVGAYVYGYGTDDSYAWNGGLGVDLILSSVSLNDYSTSLSKSSSEYTTISSLLDQGDELAILAPVANSLREEGTSIRFVYGLNSDSPLDLQIYDILGNPVASVIHNEHQSAGIYESDFVVGANIPPGSYIYRLAGAGRVLSGKLVIAR